MCVHVHVSSSRIKCSGDKAIFFLQLVEKSATILVTVLCVCAAPALEYSPLQKCTRSVAFFLRRGLFCCTEIWPVEHYVNVCFSGWNSIQQLERLVFDQAVSYCLELFCLKYYLPLIFSCISHTPPWNKAKCQILTCKRWCNWLHMTPSFNWDALQLSVTWRPYRDILYNTDLALQRC